MVIQVAQDLGYRVTQENIPREMLYIADEVFFVGTAVELTPVRSVDKIKVGIGRRGPITEAIQRRFLGTINGDVPGHARLADVRAGGGRSRCKKPLNTLPLQTDKS